MQDDGVPEAAMVIVAHPDDAEFTVGGTVAAWAKAGCRGRRARPLPCA